MREREVVRVHDAARRDMIATDARVLDRTARQQQWWLVPQHLGLGLGLGLGSGLGLGLGSGLGLGLGVRVRVRVRG